MRTVRKKRSTFPFAAPSRTGAQQAEQRAEPLADLRDFLGAVDAAVIHVQHFGHGALVERAFQRLDQGLGFPEIESASETIDPAASSKELGDALARALATAQ
jgi:hypothetical protein